MRRTKLRPTIANPLHREVRSSSPEAQKLRELAAWYRDFAERTGSAVIWESRLRMAEDLNREADQRGSVEIWDSPKQDIVILMSDFQGQGAFDCSPLSAQGIDGLCARLDTAARDDG
jgi:hypothetical protein